MRDRLVELIKEHIRSLHLCDSATYFFEGGVKSLADHLLANGVIVPPCKVGDTVYFPMETNGECEPYVDVGTVFCIGFDERHTMWISARYESGLKYYHTSDDFGKTVFLTREESEEALAKMKGGEE